MVPDGNPKKLEPMKGGGGGGQSMWLHDWSCDIAG